MFVNVTNKGAVSISNKGSCRNLAEYLNKEEIQKNKFFNNNGENIDVETVIKEIDTHSCKAVGKDESKFFLVNISPSEYEIKHLVGRDVSSFDELTADEREKLFYQLKSYSSDVMDKYAQNFGRSNINGKEDLLYFSKIEIDRTYKKTDEEVKEGIKKIGEKKEGLNIHVQIIVSRKSADGKTKLSPASGKSKGNEWELKGRGNVRRGFSHEQFKETALKAFNMKFRYIPREEEIYNSVKRKSDILNRINNKDLKDILLNNKFTSRDNVTYLMKQRGYGVTFKKGQVFFKSRNDMVTIRTKDISYFTTSFVNDETIKNICSRFNGYLYMQEKHLFKDPYISIQKVEFTVKDDEIGKNKTISYFVLHDAKTKTSMPVSRVMNYAYDNKINIYAKEYATVLKNEPLRECFTNKDIKTFKEFERDMNKKGFKIEIDAEKGYKFSHLSKGEFYVNGSVLRANLMGWGNTSNYNYNRSNYSSYATNMAKGKVMNKLENAIFQDTMKIERKTFHKGQQAYNAIGRISRITANPSSAPLILAKEAVKVVQKLSLKILKE